jgi:uncharacterized protein (DUF2237 family)
VAPAVIALVLLVGGGLFVRAWSQRGPGEVTTEDAIDRYRADEGLDPDEGILRPPAGVYTYEAEGSERLSLLDTEQQWGPTMPATVTYRDGGCWTVRIDYSTNHWHEQRFCPTDTALLDDGGSSFQRFDFVAMQVSDTNVFTCEQPAERVRIDAEPGDRWEQTCTGSSEEMGTEVTSRGTNTFVDLDELEIDGEPVGALHYHLQRTLSGDQEGTEDAHHWYSVVDGMLLRAEVDTRVVSPSPIGDVTYTEQGSFQLSTREPAR